MHSSTLFFLLTVFLVALTISVSAYPGEEKKEEKEESKEGEKGEGEKGEGKEEKKEESEDKEKAKGGATSLFSSNGLSAVISLAIASIILSIH